MQTRPKSNRDWAIYSERAADDKPDLGLAVAKKFARRAVDRNRLKRLIRQFVRKTNLYDSQKTVIRLKRSVGSETQGRLRTAEYQALKAKLMELG